MLASKIIKEYDEVFGMKKQVTDYLKLNKFGFIFSIIFIVVTSILFVKVFEKASVLTRLIAFILYITAIFVGREVLKKSIIKRYGTLFNFEKHKRESFRKKLEELNIKNREHYEVLDELLKKEIELEEDTRKFPFLNILSQLGTALIITVFLGLSIQLMVDGYEAQAAKLMIVYVVIIAGLSIFSSFIYGLRDFTRSYKLKQISKLVSELKLLKIINTKD
ncbi:hypothetical protein [Geosporobacter ferrireducens]|uniref:Uncharacterized protein n=1 Tax=Geosporobacter ferrireducens TaxID=1424294 RepID=A0A1D8GBM0_9FIRM|nr:hypothetical protein [Geosporobacter ferrireducens]AOT68295.1 hypothetical protein Gferi_01040 [Geosporobacter ferrireducens]